MKKIITFILLFATFIPNVAFAAFRFTQSNSNIVTVTNPLTFGSGTTFTLITWIKQRVATPNNNQGSFQKGNADIIVYATATATWRCYMVRDGVDADTRVANSIIFPSTTAWRFVALTYSETNGCRFYLGDLTTSPTQPTYAVNVVGDSATTVDSGNFTIGSRGGTSAAGADIAFVMLTNTEMSIGEIKRQWRRSSVVPGTLVFMHMGFTGMTTQIDWSGKRNNGAITTGTGLSIIGHVPIGSLFGR